jgi:hypothetical protein
MSIVHFKEYSGTEQSCTCPENLEETVNTAVTLMQSIMADSNSVEQHIKSAIKNSIDFEWSRCIICSLHHKQIIGGIVRGLTRISIPQQCKQTNRLMIFLPYFILFKIELVKMNMYQTFNTLYIS